MERAFNGTLKQSGSVLIMVFILSLVAGLIVVLGLETNILLRKISKTYQQEVFTFMAAEKKCCEIENSFLSDLGEEANKYSKVQFVPDTLMFGERQGIDFYRLEVEHNDANGIAIHLQSIIAIRH